MKWLAGFVVLVLIGVSRATIRPSAKIANATCFKNVDQDTVTMTFKVALNTDPEGGVSFLDNADFFQNPKVFTTGTGCSISYNSAQKIYTVDSTVDLSPVTNDNKDSNLCGLTKKTVGSDTEHEWLFLHQITAGKKTLVDMDRAYRVVCKPSNIASNYLTANIDVTTPNLNVDVNPTAIVPVLAVYRKVSSNSNQYTRLQNGASIAANTIVRLGITFDRESPYRSGVDVYGVAGLTTETGSSNLFLENHFLTLSTGCANTGGSNTPPFTTSKGFKGSVTGPSNNVNTAFETFTGDFNLWTYTATGEVHFLVDFIPCFEPGVATCNDPCLAMTNVQERRRRETEDGSVLTAFVTIEPETTDRTAAESLYTNATIIIGSTVGSILLIVVVLLVFVCFALRRRRQAGKHRQFDNISNASSRPHVIPPKI